MKKVFITGASGCVGHYLFDALVNAPDYELYLFVRNPQKLKFDPAAFRNVTLIVDDLKNIGKHAELIKQMDYVVHLAADWAGHKGNLDYTTEFFGLLDPAKCKKVIYFSTASILGPDNKPVPEAETLGTHYVRGKYQLFKKLSTFHIYPNIITLFPTWVLGGDKKHPYSHATQGILNLNKWLWLIRFFTVDASFHYIHARDMAAITKYLMENEVKGNEFILGNEPFTASRFLREVCAYYKVPVYCQVPISLTLVRALAATLGKKLHPWDIYCFKRRHFVYNVVNAATFNLVSKLRTVREILASI